MNIFQIVAAAALLLIGWLAHVQGILVNALSVFMLLMVPIAGVTTIVLAQRKSLELRLWTSPKDPEIRSHWLQALVRAVFWIAAALTVQLCVVKSQFGAEDYRSLLFQLWGATVVLVALAFLPGKKILLPLNTTLAIGSLFLATQAVMAVSSPAVADGVVLAPPFQGEWAVFHGGRSSLVNGHHAIQCQRDALDLTKVANGRLCVGDPKKLESYPAWGAPLLAPAPGKVVEAVSDLPDNAIGQTDRKNVVGNHVTIDLGQGRFVLLAHLQQKSVTVTVGETVRVGQPIARCGNSGNTSQPHLHLQVQDRADFSFRDQKTWPIFFTDVRVLRGDRARTDAPFYVRRNDRLVRD